jgi:hypothetical protein
LLDKAACAESRTLRVGDPNRAEEVDPCTDRASAAMAIHARLGAMGDPQQLRKHLSLAVGFYGLGIAAAAAMALLSWSERTLTPPPPGIASQQLPNQPAANQVNSAFHSFPVINSTLDLSSGGSDQPPKQAVAGPSPVGQANRGDHQAAAGDAANSASAIRYLSRRATVPAIATMRAWWDERTSRKTKEGWWHGRAVRVAAAKSRIWRGHWHPRAEVHSSECFALACLFWRNQHAVNYEPPRNVTQ